MHALRPLIGFATLLWVTAATAAEAEFTWHTDATSAIADAEERELPLLVYMTSSHCPYCVRMKNQTLVHPNVTDELGKKFVALYLSRGTAPDLERKLAVRAYPTTVVLRPDQTELGRVTGFVGPEQLVISLQRLEALHMAAKKTATTVK